MPAKVYGPREGDGATEATLVETRDLLADLSPLTNEELRATPVSMRDEITYWSKLGRGFSITSGIVPIGITGEQDLAAIVNPVGSGFDVFLDLGEFGCSANTTFRRYRGSTLTDLHDPITPSNLGGSTTETSVLRMYIPPNYSRIDGNVGKTAHIAAYQQYLTHINGRTRLRPGQSICWTIVGPGGLSGSMTASIYFEYWELPAT